MKNQNQKSYGPSPIVVGAFTFLVVAVVGIVIFLSMSLNIRKFNIQLQVLSNETKACTVTHGDESFQIDNQTLGKILYVPRKLDRHQTFGTPEELDSITLDLLQRKESVTVVMTQCQDDLLKVSIESDRYNRSYYFSADTDYEDILGLLRN